MIIGALRLTFMANPDHDSARGVAQRIKDRLWSKFKAAVAEMPAASGSEVILGVSIVGYEENQTKDRMNQIIHHLHEWSSVELVHDESELVFFDDIEIERDFEKYNP